MISGTGRAGRSTAPLLAPVTDRDDDTFSFERLLGSRGFHRIAGTDEAGRGPLAGPVVAAAVILPTDCDYRLFRDSKKTSALQRGRLREHLLQIGAAVGIGIVDAATIDRINILQASLQAMAASIDDLADQGAAPDFVLVDGTFLIPKTIDQQSLVKGDSRSASISAASIIAKITRDEIMADLHERYPGYDFAGNKGYPTRHHRQAIRQFGPSPVHRLSFSGVKEFVSAAR
ncbi:ribonuclease HII [Desulfofustis limnaeus]|jgi:ribonuclease HII|uniref:Ribonuclease HII n=1 Tax=Desulfofustis limnaeus TaxID=2740163 RepID=A0ABM7W709_9BACT|nr:ribonuclease HII [Desulfofustis limnaeus]MDX9895145.1 ribonuclease HII [Desulfofustis sp.]BDD86696.1 ribonuclease HII [Desulfofustis limnaeus]